MTNFKLEIPAIKVKQWLPIWDSVIFNKNDNREKPKPEFLIFTIKAGLLKKLSKVYPRRADDKRDINIGIQRKHDPERSVEIGKYVKYGYPLSDILTDKKKLKDHQDLQMPGWLPTSIVANILVEKNTRGGLEINKNDLILVKDDKGGIELVIPKSANDKNWNPAVPPIEIIDGQHRLWSFQLDDAISNDFDLPVVAFINLDITWQAYLFYTINVKPKKINRSLAYDLYPLLRVEEWLEKAPDTAHVYKETRAQEITELLWGHKKSPWKERINLLGDTQKTIGEGQQVPNITQAAYIRNLIASFIKTSTTKGLGGLFGAKLLDDSKTPLEWNRMQQATFIIFIWQKMYEAVKASKLTWAQELRKEAKTFAASTKTGFDDLAWTCGYSLLTSDQGVRGFLHVINDLVYTRAESLQLRKMKWTVDEGKIKEDKILDTDVDKTLIDFNKSSLNKFIELICNELVKFDWRTSSTPGLSEDDRKAKMLFKGSSGYKELREQLLYTVSKSINKEIKEATASVLKELGYAKQ
jgi:DGQHR domain-containing protein